MSVDSIHETMLNNISDSYQKTVGFPTYDITRTAAIALDSLTQRLENDEAGLDVDNLAGDALTRFVQQRKGVYRRQATCAIGTITVTGTGTVKTGDMFESVGGIQYMATQDTAIVNYGDVPIKAIAAGSSGNVAANAVTMMPITIAGINGCTNLKPITEGYDEETDDSLRTRYYTALRCPPTSGNQYHYKAWAKEIAGVGDARIFPLARGANTVDVVLIDTESKPASELLVQQVQDYIDPYSSGTGAGEAPIGAYCYVSAASAKEININVTITLAADYTIAQAKSNMIRSLQEYLKQIAFTQDYVSAGKLASAINGSAGVADYSNFSVNGSTENIILTVREVAVLGEVEANVSG